MADSRTRDVLAALRIVERALRTAGRPNRTTAAATTRAERAVLHCLADAPAVRSLSTLAACLHLDASTVSVTVSRLVTRGLLRKAPCPDDRRRCWIVLTPTGRRVAQGAPNGDAAALTRALAILPSSEAQELIASLQRLTEALHQTDDSRA